ncbi:MAG: DNA primase small subunit domain-containing protein, partial [Candidatus Micrarchaeota archaeon]
KDAVKLKEFLERDFGFKNVSVNYSGNKGFHFHLRSENVRKLSQDARRQLTEFLTGPETPFVGESEDKGRETDLTGPSEKSLGWGKMFFDFAFEFVKNATLDDLKERGMRSNTAVDFLSKKQMVLGLLRAGKWRFASKKFWDSLYSQFKRENGVEVDAHVTLDLARLIRIPESLHGDTGFAAKVVSGREGLAGFSLEESVVFKSEKTINVLSHGDISLEFPERLVLKEKQPCEVPLASGVLLLCKKKASLLLKEKSW